eukprot:scaffold24081_cov75-Phaeocystis_antarctica.AAC.1
MRGALQHSDSKLSLATQTTTTCHTDLKRRHEAFGLSCVRSPVLGSVSRAAPMSARSSELCTLLHHGNHQHQTRSRGGSKSRWLGPGPLRCLFCSLSSLCRKERTYSPTVQLAPVGVVISGQ